MDSHKKVVAQSKHELAEAYNVSLKTLRSWLEPIQDDIGEYSGKTFTPKQVQKIYEILGRP